MITIHAQDETTFTNNGLGVLDPISCDVKITINGSWELELVHSLDDEKIYDSDGVNKIAKNNIIKITNMNIVNEVTSSYQLFRIYDTEQTLSTIKAIAFPIALEASNDAIIEELKIEKESATWALQDIMAYLLEHGVTKYTVESDYSQEGVVIRQKKGSWASTNLIAAISGSDDGSIINHWGGEVAYDNYKIIVNGMLGRKRIAYNPSFYFTEAVWYARNPSQLYANYMFQKESSIPCFFAHKDYGLVMMVSLERGGEDWLFAQTNGQGGYGELQEPIEGEAYGMYKPCILHFEFNYKGQHWYASKTHLDTNYTISCPEIDFPYYGQSGHDVDNAKFLIDSANFQVIEDKYECRVGKNVAGLSVNTDISGVATRLYPVSEDNVRLKRTVEGVEVSYVDSDGEQGHIQDYPYVRSAFIKAPYKLVDTTWEGTVHTDTQIATHDAINDLTSAVQDVAAELWQSLNEGLPWHSKWYEPEWIKSIMNDAIAQCQKDITANIAHPTWKSVIQSCIKNGLNYIKDQDIPDFYWDLVTGSTDTYCYTNGHRIITGQYYYVDKKFSWFNALGNYEPWWDISSMDWIQPKGSNVKKKYGDNQRYYARNTYVYCLGDDGSGNTQFNEYWFDDDGYWDGTANTASEWNWYQSGSKWWFGESGATSSDTNKYAHDCWLYIEDGTHTTGLYYFDSDGYCVDSVSKTNVGWGWHEANQENKWYFGSTNKDQYKVLIESQWLKVDGEWRKFKADGTLTDMKTLKTQFINLLSTNLASAIANTITYHQNYLYNLLYTEMYQYCWELYDDGLDKPTINVTADIVELSKMNGYEDFAKFEQAHLGNDVQIHDYYHNVHRTERIVGLKYDCIRECNTEITIGAKSVYWEKIGGQMFTKTTGKKIETIEMGHTDTDNYEGLTAGVGINIDANGVISADNILGDVFGGTEVSYDPTITTGQLLGTIYINGTGYGIYAEEGGSDVSITPRLQNGTKVADYEIDGQTGSLYAPTPVSYTPGDNVQISNQNVISATDTTYSDFAGSAHGLVPAVGSGDSGYLKSDGSWDEPEGTVVEANPSETATDTLSTILIGETVYDIQGGGGIDLSLYDNWNNGWQIERQETSLSIADGEIYRAWYDPNKSGSRIGKKFLPTGMLCIAYDSSDNQYQLPCSLERVSDYETDMMLYYSAINNTGHTITKLHLFFWFDSPKSGSSGGGGASTLDDLTDVDISNPSNGQVLTYDDQNDKWVNANGGTTVIANPSGTATENLTKLQVGNDIYSIPSGGGGSGNAITYGYEPPSASANDGDLFIGLDEHNSKIAEYLYMTNQWQLIEGNFEPFNVLMTRSYRNSSAGSTYTATSAGTLLCINQNLNGEASTKTLTSPITTTGTVIATNTYDTSWNSPNRNQNTTVSIIQVEAGDTITFGNSIGGGSYTTQLHMVLKSLGTLDAITRLVSEAKADNSFSSDQTYSITSAGKYLVLGFQCRGTGAGTQYATISANPTCSIDEELRGGQNHSVSVAVVDTSNTTFTFSWGNQGDYATKGYAIYKIG